MARICYLKSLPHWLQQCASSTAILASWFLCECTQVLLRALQIASFLSRGHDPIADLLCSLL